MWLLTASCLWPEGIFTTGCQQLLKKTPKNNNNKQTKTNKKTKETDTQKQCTYTL